MEDLDKSNVETTPPEPAAPPPEEAANRSALFIVFLVVVIDLLGFAIVLPILPRYGKLFMPGGEANPWTEAVLGMIMASYSAMQFVFMPIWGRLSDRVGRRPILLMGLASSVIFYVLFGVASDMGNQETASAEGAVGALILILVARLGAGIAGATIGTAQAAIADSTSQQGRARGMALIGAAFGIGFFLGPILGAGARLIFEHSLGAPGYLAAGLSAIALILGLRYLPETRREGSPQGRRHWLNLEGWRLALDTPAVPGLILVFFLSTFAFGNFEATMSVLTQVPGLALQDAANFLIFSYIGFVLALAQGVLYRRLAKRVPELTFMFSGCILMMLGLAGIGAIAYLASQAETRQPALVVALLTILVVAITGFAFMVPSVQALVSRLSDPARQGEILGINQSMNAIARILGPAIGLPLFRPGHHVLPYIFGTLLLAISLMLTWRLSRLDVLGHLGKEGPHAA
ncbi:hypothetical protein AYO40_05540 [Planctomycetaceae bacterium SCGC AG-212-D15]|nr:hypothetical protein AYO40_05540 [Planctomycetaceae bacterium SCGC AG-212-D15]